MVSCLSLPVWDRRNSVYYVSFIFVKQLTLHRNSIKRITTVTRPPFKKPRDTFSGMGFVSGITSRRLISSVGSRGINSCLVRWQIHSLFTMPPVGCQLSTLKKAEERDERILRLFNPLDSQSSDATVASGRAIQACTQTRLDEQPVKSVVKSATTSARFYRDKRGHLATRLCE